jgi:hypothetical protein
MAENILKGRRSLSGTRAPRVYADERTCSMNECSTKLSKYNRREFCFAHAPTKFPRLRGRIVPEN